MWCSLWLAGGLSAVAAAVVLLESVRRGPLMSWRHGWGAALMSTALVNIVIYVDIVLRDPRESAALPVVQRCGTLFLVLWMTATILAVATERPERSEVKHVASG